MKILQLKDFERVSVPDNNSRYFRYRYQSPAGKKQYEIILAPCFSGFEVGIWSVSKKTGEPMNLLAGTECTNVDIGSLEHVLHYPMQTTTEALDRAVALANDLCIRLRVDNATPVA